MNWMHRYISRRTFVIIFNATSVFGLWAKEILEYTAESIIACILTMGIMNYIVWSSMRHFPDWK